MTLPLLLLLLVLLLVLLLLQGCGLVTYVDRQAAGNAIAQLHGKYVFPGSDCAIVVEWMDLKKQRPVGKWVQPLTWRYRFINTLQFHTLNQLQNTVLQVGIDIIRTDAAVLKRCL